ncbi:MAG: 16S rRNA (cytosine(967)-C(5))-methyltransferase RsmB [Gammaproteobacteria bacterium]|nr:16S rRNA (cytosine(967)-C(5))-methyltransferase RsmB [Gammaproteobacteria bacterium]
MNAAIKPRPGGDVRAHAARALLDVIGNGVSLTKLGDSYRGDLPDRRDRALVSELVRGVVRWWFRYHRILDTLLERQLKPRDDDLRMLLCLGLHQVLDLRVPDHAAVAATVAACDALKKSWGKGLVNAVLRNAIRRRSELEQELDADPRLRFSHPDWLLEALRLDWPDAWERIAAANNMRAPMTLRVNLRRVSRSVYRDLLATAGMDAIETKWSHAGLSLRFAVDVDELPGFADGLVSVQDEAAQLAAMLLAPEPGARVLDACAAPGGKLAHLLETHPDLQVQAVESDPVRARRLLATGERIGFDCRITIADVTRTADWWDGVPFDAILADVPCSATGVIRRQPDVKLHRRCDDIARLAAQQAAILEALWPALRRGGKLLYATCSVLRTENEDQIARFAQRHSDVAVGFTAGAPACGTTLRYGLQVLPGEHDMDGFYYACLVKNRN